MKRSCLLLLAIVLVLPVAALAVPPGMPEKQSRPIERDAAQPGKAAAEQPLAREEFVWKEIPTGLHHAEAARRLNTGLGRCSQFAPVTRAEAGMTVIDVFFKVGENRSPWPIGRIELAPKDTASRVEIGVNRMFFRGAGKYHTMWGNYLEEKYECPAKPEKHSGGMQHP